MKKLTDKDAILCKCVGEAISIRSKFKLDIDNKNIIIGIKDYKKIILYKNNVLSNKKYAKENGFKITKASKILNKGVSKKELLRRIEKLEKVMIDNTQVTVSKTPEIEGIKNELTELPEKWCIKLTNENFEKVDKTYLVGEGYHHSRKVSVNNWSYSKQEGYTEITFEQFKKWVLKEEEKPLSIREVQVKVNSQEEANECAEIAKACGEKISTLKDVLTIHKQNGECYFRQNHYTNNFGVFDFYEKTKEISIQEFRERFGKPKEIDWNKAGQLLESKWNVVLTSINDCTPDGIEFSGVAIVDKFPNSTLNNKVGYYSENWAKESFKLCTEPITLSN